MEGNKIVKITTAAQFAKLVAILEQKPYLAKGFHKSLNKINIKEEWNTVSEELNSMGPPSRSGEGWMKVWADFKFKLKKKLIHNKAESYATGGGPYKKNSFSAVEEAAINLLDMRAVTEHRDPFGIKRTRTVSIDPEPNLDTVTDINEIEELSTSPASPAAPALKKSKRNKNQEKLGLLEQQVKLQKELCIDLKNKLSEIERYTRRMCKAKEEKLRLYKAELKTKEKYRKAHLEIRKSELEIKSKKIELEELIRSQMT